MLYEFALAKERPDAGLLDDYVRQYPEHAAALTSFAVSLALDLLTETKESPAELPKEANDAISRAMSRFQNRLHAVKTSRVQGKSVVSNPQNPFTALTRDQIRDFATRIHANGLFIMKLRDREIDSATMTSGFQQHVADELKAPLEVVMAHFAGSSEIRREMHFKSESKPQAGTKQTFQEAVQNCGLTPEQQTYLLSL